MRTGRGWVNFGDMIGRSAGRDRGCDQRRDGGHDRESGPGRDRGRGLDVIGDVIVNVIAIGDVIGMRAETWSKTRSKT